MKRLVAVALIATSLVMLAAEPAVPQAAAAPPVRLTA